MPLTMTKAQQMQAIKFQDTLGKLIDQEWQKNGLDIAIVQQIVQDEAYLLKKRIEELNHPCEKCGKPCRLPENPYGEFICQDCVDNANEAAAERQYERYHDGGSGFKTLREQQIDAWKLK